MSRIISLCAVCSKIRENFYVIRELCAILYPQDNLLKEINRSEAIGMEKCNIKALAVAIGVLWAIYVLLLGWIAAFGWGREMVTVLSSLYIGYKPTFVGGIIGGIWAFVDGAIAGAIIAWVYNLVAKK
jgi:hypothetical protein